jgi:hypothetical protein
MKIDAVEITYINNQYFEALDRPYMPILGTPFTRLEKFEGKVMDQSYGIGIQGSAYEYLKTINQERRGKSFKQTAFKIWKWTFHLSVMTELN